MACGIAYAPGSFQKSQLLSFLSISFHEAAMGIIFSHMSVQYRQVTETTTVY